MKINVTMLFLIVILLTITVSAQTDSSSNVKLPLSATQMDAVKNIRNKAATEAAPLALQLATAVKQIYDNMLADAPNAKLREKLSKQMTGTVVKILLIKGQSIREMVGILTPEQKKFLKTEMTKPDAPADLSELMERVFNIPKM